MRTNSIRPVLGVALAIAASGTARHADAQEGSEVPLYDNLGRHHYAISTSVPLAQQYFDQGLRLYYAFNHAEAIGSFEKAAELDPNCAMCYWGIALSYGPNINLPMDSASGVAAYEAIRRAQSLEGKASPRERALIRAAAERYEAVPRENRAALDSAYARAMGRVVQEYPGDIEARTLHAEALMDLSPWYYWNADGSPRPDTPEILAQLEHVLEVAPDHPGANHFFIHAVEEVDPERAVPMAERLASLMPGAGHLVHMPGHIYIRVGRYEDAIRANEHAVHADETYIQDRSPALGMYTVGYYPHNYDFLAFAAAMVGRSAQAIGAAETMLTLTPADLIRAPGMTFLQHHRTRHLQMKVRFGRWDDILSTPEPDADLLHARAMWSYARGRALVARGDLRGAEAALRTVRETSTNPEIASEKLEFNTSGDVLAIAAEVLAGHIAAARNDHETAIRHMREAVRLEDALVYGEPPDWTIPVRQDFGEILLAAGQPAEAERVFQEDLRNFPENGWSLDGLARALRAQGRAQEAAGIEERFRRVWASADVAQGHAGH